MTTAQIESRLAALEHEVATLKGRRSNGRNGKAHPARALEKIHGTFENDAAFKEAMRLGRKWRKSQDDKTGKASKEKRR